MTNNSHEIRIREAKKKRTKKASAKRKLKRQGVPTAKSLKEMHSKNLRAYSKMKLNQKYGFAFCKYFFEKYPNHKAIYLDVTNMTTQQGYNRCIRAGTEFKELPPGFIIVFSKLAVTDVMSTGDAARYQVKLTDTSFLLPHRYPCTPYGLGQFVDCCLSSNSAIEWMEGQNMKTKQCEIINKIGHRLRPDYKNLSPAYVKVISKIKQDDELLLPSGYGGRQRIVA